VLYLRILSRVLAAVLTRLVELGELIASQCFLSHLLFSASCLCVCTQCDASTTCDQVSASDELPCSVMLMFDIQGVQLKSI
jgi:hypothetical protein